MPVGSNVTSRLRNGSAVEDPARVPTHVLTPTIALNPPHSQVFLDPARHKLLIAGRRFGKSTYCIAEVLKTALNIPESNIWYVAPELQLAKRDVWEPMKKYTKPFWGCKPNETDHYIKFKNGSSVMLIGVNQNPERLRGGLGKDLIIFDEMKDIKSEAWDIVQPSLSDRLGRTVFVGTPGGHDWLYELIFGDGMDKVGVLNNPNWSVYQFTTAQGGYVSWAEIVERGKSMARKMWEQEYFASFINFAEMLAYYSFDRGANVQDTPFNPDLALLWSMDFNVEPYCSVLAQYHPSVHAGGTYGRNALLLGNQRVNPAGTLHVLDEIVMPVSGNTNEMCEVFYKRTEPYRKLLRSRGKKLRVVVTGDASSNARHTSANSTDQVMIAEFFKRKSNEFDGQLWFESGNPEVRTRVNTVNGYLLSAVGMRRLFVNPKCTWLTRDLNKVKFADTGATMLDQRTDKTLTHISDALGYLVMAFEGEPKRQGGVISQVVC